MANSDYITTLSPQYQQFHQLVNTQPRLKSYWDFDKRVCHIDALENTLYVLSHGEKIMAQFLAGVWFGENRLDFNFFKAVEVLEPKELSTIRAWMDAPFWP